MQRTLVACVGLAIVVVLGCVSRRCAPEAKPEYYSEPQQSVRERAGAVGAAARKAGKRVVLVTGAAGFVGFHTALRIHEEGDAVLGLDNFNRYYDVRLKRARAGLLRRAGMSTLFEVRVAAGHDVSRRGEGGPRHCPRALQWVTSRAPRARAGRRVRRRAAAGAAARGAGDTRHPPRRAGRRALLP